MQHTAVLWLAGRLICAHRSSIYNFPTLCALFVVHFILFYRSHHRLHWILSMIVAKFQFYCFDFRASIIAYIYHHQHHTVVSWICFVYFKPFSLSLLLLMVISFSFFSRNLLPSSCFLLSFLVVGYANIVFPLSYIKDCKDYSDNGDFLFRVCFFFINFIFFFIAHTCILKCGEQEINRSSSHKMCKTAETDEP